MVLNEYSGRRHEYPASQDGKLKDIQVFKLGMGIDDNFRP